MCAADKSRAKVVRTLSGHGHRVNALTLNTDHLCRTGGFDHKGAHFESGDAGAWGGGRGQGGGV